MAETQAAQTGYPNLNLSGANSSIQNAKDTIVSSKYLLSNLSQIDSCLPDSQSAMNTIANHPVTQSVTNGPVADKAIEQANKTSAEFSNVAASRKIPDTPAATGQPLTHYHSMFYNILSWENPRVTGIVFAAVISVIFFTRYVPILALTLKGTFTILGVISAAELAGKLIFERGLASQVRPRKYYTIPRETLERSVEDIEQLVNFFVIEFQRIIFAENIYATITAFTTALIGWLLVKFVPTWGIALIATSALFLVPLVYITNKEFIDEHLNNAGTVINDQTSQMRDLAAQHTSRASEVAKSTFGEYSAKAQELMGQAKGSAQETAASPSAPNPANLNPMKNEPEREVKREDFPSAPSAAPVSDSTSSSAHTYVVPESVPGAEPVAQ